jgi:hypothetical protein
MIKAAKKQGCNLRTENMGKERLGRSSLDDMKGIVIILNKHAVKDVQHVCFE